MKKPDIRVLDRNLERLLKECYTPVTMAPSFRRRLEHEWREGVRRLSDDQVTGPTATSAPRGRLLRFATVAAAAAVVLFLAGTFWFNAPSAPLGAAELVAQGDTALGFAGEPWRAATESELAQGFALSGTVDVQTPAGSSLLLYAGDTERAIEVGTATSATLQADATTLRASIEAGLVTLHAPGTDAPVLVATSPSGELRMDFGRAEMTVDGPRDRVVVIDGQATYVGPAGTSELHQGDELLFVGGAPTAADIASTTPTAPGPSRRSVEVTEEAPDESEPIDTVGAAVAGRVLGLDPDTGESTPLTDFRVAILRKTAGNEYSAPVVRDLLSTDGSFLWDYIIPREYSVFVHAEGYAIAKLGLFGLEKDTVTDVGDVQLVRGATVRGRVYEVESGAPVRDALVLSEADMPTAALPLRAGLDSTPDPWLNLVDIWLPNSTRTRADGTFEIAHLSPGKHLLRIAAPGYGPSWTQPFTVEDEEQRDGLVIELETGSVLEGRVFGSDGSPTPDAMLIIALMEESMHPLMNFSQVMTDQDGYYRVEDLPGLPMLAILLGTAPGQMPPRVKPAIMESGLTTVVDFEDEQNKTKLFGRIFDAEGEPMATNMGIFPLAESVQDTEEMWEATSSDPDGRYAFEGLDPGEYMIVAIGGRGTSLRIVDFVEVPEGPAYEHDVQLDTKRIAGTCTSGFDGKPLACVVILEILGWDGKATFAGLVVSDAQGRYDFDSLPNGNYLVTSYPIDGEHGFEQTPVLTADDADPSVSEDLVHFGAGTLRLRVVDGDGKPLSGVYVELTNDEGRTFTFNRTPITDADGVHLALGVRPGRFRIDTTLAGYESGSTSFECRVGNEHEISIVMEAQTDSSPTDR